MNVVPFENKMFNGQTETWLFYNYKEELDWILDHYNLKMGDNRFHGVDFTLTENGGEICLGIPNFDFVGQHVAYEFSNDPGEEKAVACMTNEIKELIGKIDMVHNLKMKIINGPKF